jgi:hypothetical protein
MKNTKKLIIGMFFLIFGLLILQSCERVESLTESELPDSNELINCNYITLSNANLTDDFTVLVYTLSDYEYVNNAESCYIERYEVIDSLLVTDSEFEPITKIELNLNDSVYSINGFVIEIESDIIINYGRK